MTFLGVDPDLHSLALAWVNESFRIEYVRVLDAKKSPDPVVAMLIELANHVYLATEYEVTLRHNTGMYAVEAQELYLGKGVNPRDIVHLAQVAGAAFLWAHQYTGQGGYFPRPAEWKGQQDKLAHQRKILAKAGIEVGKVMGGKDPYCVPKDPASIPGGEALRDSDWKHVNDAIGLAQYAAETFAYETSKREMLARVRAGK